MTVEELDIRLRAQKQQLLLEADKVRLKAVEEARRQTQRQLHRRNLEDMAKQVGAVSVFPAAPPCSPLGTLAANVSVSGGRCSNTSIQSLDPGLDLPTGISSLSPKGEGKMGRRTHRTAGRSF